MEVTVDVGEKLRKLSKSDLSGILHRVGAHMVTVTQEAFDLQGRGGGKWAPRHVPNVLGILSDLARGRGIPARRFEPRPALKDTGRLQNSIAYEIVDEQTVEFGTNVEYAQKMQSGGTEEVDVTKDMKQRLADFLKANPEHHKSLGFLFRRDTYKQRVPARPFVMFTKEDAEDVRRIVSWSFGRVR